MRQLNFLLVFALCLGLVLFGTENTTPTAIRVVPGFDIEAPLSIELLLAMGLGGILAWLSGLWGQLQQKVESWKVQRELALKTEKIQKLEAAIARLQGSVDEPIPQTSSLKIDEPTSEEGDSVPGEATEAPTTSEVS